MTDNSLATKNDFSAIEKVIVGGDLASMTPEQRVQYYLKVCGTIGVNPYTRPFEYITLNGKLTLYARKDATEQLRKNNRVSISRLEKEQTGDVYAVTAYATTPDGRTDASLGAVFIGGLRGENLANAFMKAETKAKRRVTLSICGLGFLDETEVDSIPGAQKSTAEYPQQPETKTTGAKPPAIVVFDDGLPELTLDDAIGTTNSKGEMYGDLTTETLAHMANALRKKITDGSATDEQRTKLAAAQTILAARDSGQL